MSSNLDVRARRKASGTAKRQSQAVGYVRVSTLDQPTERQLEGLKFDRVFEDRGSGIRPARPQLAALLAHVKTGDTVFAQSIDRLARSLRGKRGPEALLSSWIRSSRMRPREQVDG